MNTSFKLAATAFAVLLATSAAYAANETKSALSDEAKQEILQSCIASAEGKPSAEEWMKSFTECASSKSATVHIAPLRKKKTPSPQNKTSK